MAQRKTLTEAQVAVLRWIGNGCPSGVMENDFHRISAAALRSRGLVTTSGRGTTWKAEVTPAGEEYLELVDGPNAPIPRQANVPVTQLLVDDVIAAGGSLRVPRASWQDRDGVDFERRAQLAQRHGRVPPGKRLKVTVVSRDEVDIELVDAPGSAGGRAELVPISVPEKVGRYHPAARQFRDRTERHEVSRALLPRATRIIHTIAVEAERRGWSAEASSESKNGYGRTDWTGAKDGHLQITAGGYDFWLRLQEEDVHTRGRWEEEVHRYRNVSPDSYFYRDRQLPRGSYDADGTGRLKLELHWSGRWTSSGRQSRWADRPSWMLESRLSYLLREIEERIVEADDAAEQRRIAAEKAAEAARREAEERERKWHLLMRQAEERLVECTAPPDCASRVRHGRWLRCFGATATLWRRRMATAPRQLNGWRGRADTSVASTPWRRPRRCQRPPNRPRKHCKLISRTVGVLSDLSIEPLSGRRCALRAEAAVEAACVGRPNGFPEPFAGVPVGKTTGHPWE